MEFYGLYVDRVFVEVVVRDFYVDVCGYVGCEGFVEGGIEVIGFFDVGVEVVDCFYDFVVVCVIESCRDRVIFVVEFELFVMDLYLCCVVVD